MKRNKQLFLAFQVALALLFGDLAAAQNGEAVYIDPSVGNKLYRRSLIMNRNKVESIIFNKGTFGEPQNPTLSGGWPIGSGHGHVSEMTMLVGAEVTSPLGDVLHIISES